ncbi:MAG: aminotransferase class V-fold PLP-dependent enzyme [Clostridia bacterium]|nr:aminotransferase class V-fold PLP-dependent enzyme [Clostridia bacterium]
MIYFDNAATSYPKPPAVGEALLRGIGEYGGNPGRGGHRLSLAAAEAVYDCRCTVADFFDAPSPECVVFTSGATAALNLAITTAVRRGMHVLLSDREHNAVARPLYRLAREGIIDYEIYPTGGDVVREIERRLRRNTGLVVACHVSNITGFLLPVEAIGALCRERGIAFVVDAAGSAGHLPISLSSLPCNALCAPGHKGLLGVPGVGIAILNGWEGKREFLVGGSGVDSLSHTMPSALPERYEAGTLPTPAILALGAGLRHLRHYGLARVMAEEERLRARLCEGLLSRRDLRVYEPDNRHGPLLFTHATVPPEEIAGRLDNVGVAVRAGYHCAPLAHRTVGTPPGGAVRLSVGIGNHPREAEEFLALLSRVLPETQ